MSHSLAAWRRRGSARTALAAALGAVGLAGLAACSAVPAPEATPSGAEPPPAILEEVRFDGYRAGARDVLVLAARATIDADARVAELEQVEIRLADRGDGAVRVRAERGSVQLDGDDFRLLGRVTGSVGRDQRFTTSEVRYEARAQRLWTDRPVRVDREALWLEGDGMELDLARRRLQIKGRVRTHLEGRG